ncbi:MAG: hypothetical protein J0M12_08410 [Deltaproteobacteria bacterium]|nr:hypothetical protein [Deltaproteobacteria bacterium]
MSGFGSNISSLRALRRLAENSSALGRTYERLSTGQRITRASDDAAGLAIADSLRVRSRLYGAANRNINDALSMLNIADGTLENQTSILTRLQELAEQSANGVFSAAQRETMNREYISLVKEFGRLGDTASFNGVSLLKNEGSTTNFQVGIDGQSNSNISFTTTATGSLSGTIELEENPDPSTFVGSGTLAQLTASYNNHMWRTTWRDGQGQEHDVLIAIRDGGLGYSNQVRLEIYARTSEVGAVGEDTISITPIAAGDEWSILGRGYLARDSVTGRLSELWPLSYRMHGVTSYADLNIDLSAIHVFSSAETGKQQSMLEFTGIENVGRARDALTILARRLDQVGSLRGSYGATQSRLQAALSLVMSQGESTKGAESRIRDIDVAAESARLVSLQILQQAAASVLASANQQPRLLLDLLRSG